MLDRQILSAEYSSLYRLIVINGKMKVDLYMERISLLVASRDMDDFS